MAKGKNQPLPGMETTTIKAITEKAIEYAAARDTRMDFLKKEVELKNALIVLMHEHGRTVYKDEDAELDIELKSTEKVRVKVGHDDEDEDEDHC